MSATTEGRPVRVAIVGAGSLAERVHYPSLTNNPQVDLVGMCDIDAERLNLVGERFGIASRYADYRQMVNELAPEAVYAIGQPEYMYSIWSWCLARGIHLFVEKPLGLTLHQARMLTYLAEENNCITQVGFQRRASPVLIKAQEMIAGRGPVTHALCTFYKYAPEPLLGARDHMMDDGVHAIDTLRAVCGGDIVHIDSSIRRVGTPDVNFFSAQITFSTGAIGCLVNSWTSGRRSFSVQVHVPGAAAELDLEGEGRVYLEGDTTGIRLSAQEVAGSDEFYIYGGFQSKTNEFIRCIRSGERPSSHFGDAVLTMQAAEEILHGSRLVP